MKGEQEGKIITGVFYVPELKNNLLNIGQLQEKGLAVLFQHGSCKIYHREKGLILETTMSSNRMFYFTAGISVESVILFLHHHQRSNSVMALQI